MKYGFPMLITVAIGRIMRIVARPIVRLKTIWLCWIWGVKTCGRAWFYGETILRTHKWGDIVIGNDVVFNANQKLNTVGLSYPTILDTRPGGRIEFGANSGASSVVISSAVSVKIGSNCMIGGNVKIFDHDFHPLEWKARRRPQDMSKLRKKAVVIGDDCFVGTNAIILKGSNIGARSIIAAGSVVFSLVVPPDSLVKGNPAVVVSRV